MRLLAFSRYVLGIGAVGAMLAGCGGSQPQIGTVPQIAATGSVIEGSGPRSLEHSLRLQPLKSGKERVLYSFTNSPDGATPYAGLLAVNGTLFGTTEGGGAGGCSYGGCGTVFAMSEKGTERDLYSFKGPPKDASLTEASLIDVRGKLFGTSGGGTDNAGTVFEVSTSGVERVLYSFRNNQMNGDEPQAALIFANGLLYGTTSSTGNDSVCGPYYGGCGTVFALSLSGKERVLYTFKGGKDGVSPYSPVIMLNGSLYGTTLFGGGVGCAHTEGCGTAFVVSTSGKERVLHRFGSAGDGDAPQGGLIDLNGVLYGTTVEGGSGCAGSGGCGTVFKLSTSGKEQVLYSFKGGNDDGASPHAGLIALGGALYGTTSGGGPANLGTVFEVGTSGVERLLHSFKGGSDGSYAYSGVIAVNGALYGTTLAGGDPSCESYFPASGCGAVFEVAP